MIRETYITRNILLSGGMQKETAIQLIKNAPLDPVKPIEVVIREYSKKRGNDANSLYWAGPLEDISSQVWIEGKKYSKETWHEFLKREFLPDLSLSGITKDGYQKWEELPGGEVVCIGSTTDLTVRGFSEYLEKVHAYGASHGVQFHTNRMAA